MKGRIKKELKQLRREVARNWIELCKVRRDLSRYRKDKSEKTVRMMQTSVREMLAISREI